MLAGKQDFTKNLEVKWGIIYKVIQQLSSRVCTVTLDLSISILHLMPQSFIGSNFMCLEGIFPMGGLEMELWKSAASCTLDFWIQKVLV